MGLKSYNLTLDPYNGQTPLDEEEKESLKINIISTQGELNEFEQKNIEFVLMWLINKKLIFKQVLTFRFLKYLHYQMFKDVWYWAGKFRKSNKNIGVDKTVIAIEIKKLLDDCGYWNDKHIFSPEEIAVRFKHHLVSIHPFSNGNSRHSRLMADILVEKVF